MDQYQKMKMVGTNIACHTVLFASFPCMYLLNYLLLHIKDTTWICFDIKFISKKNLKRKIYHKTATNWNRQIFYTFSYLDGMLLGNLTKRGYILVPRDTHLIMYINLLRMHKQDRKMDMAQNSIYRFPYELSRQNYFWLINYPANYRNLSSRLVCWLPIWL